MIAPTWTSWRARLLIGGCAVAIAALALTAGPQPAQARVWVSVGGCCYYGPGPYYGYYPPPYYYAPPVGYYPPPPGAYPPPVAAPSAYVPAAPATPGPIAAPAEPRITYTSKPAFTNSAGQTCREYTTGAVYGTACKQADGQWHVVN